MIESNECCVFINIEEQICINLILVMEQLLFVPLPSQTKEVKERYGIICYAGITGSTCQKACSRLFSMRLIQ